MNCPHCNKNLIAEASICPLCGHVIHTETFSATTQKANRFPKRVIKIILLSSSIFLLALLGIAYSFITLASTKASLESLIPDNSVGYVVMDAPLIWNEIQPFLSRKEIQSSISNLQKELNINLGNEVLPNIVHLAFVVFDSKQNTVNGAFLLEATNLNELKKTIFKIQDKIQKDERNEWQKIKVDGADAWLLQDKDAPFEVCVAFYQGWLVAGVGYDGKSSVAKIISAGNGSTSSLADNKDWQSIAEKLPENPSIAVFINHEPYLDFISSFYPFRVKLDSKIKSKGFTVLCATQSDESIKVQMLSKFLDDKDKALMKEFAQLGKVNGSILEQMPKNTIAAFVAGNPSKWLEIGIKSVEQWYGSAPQENDEAYKAFISEMKKASGYLNQLTGEFGIGLVWNGMNDVDFVVLAQAENKANLQQAYSEINSYLKNMGMKFAVNGNVCQTDDKQIAWGIRDRFLTVSNKLSALSDPGGAELALPPSAKDSLMVITGDFKFMNSVLNEMGQSTKQADLKLSEELRASGIINAKWCLWCSADPAGNSSEGAFELTGIQWRKAIKALASIETPMY